MFYAPPPALCRSPSPSIPLCRETSPPRLRLNPYMRPFLLLACSLPLLMSTAFAQHLISFGVKGGVPLTDAFVNNTTTGVDVVTQTFSSSKNFVAGLTLELKLPLGFSVEADALYRPLNLTTTTHVLPNTFFTSSQDIHSGEFPILAKYHFLHLPLVSPYVEAGPNFRAVASGGSYLSGKGFAMGGGVDFKLPIVRISPEIRYTHWGQDGTLIFGEAGSPSNRNQAEFLIGLSF